MADAELSLKQAASVATTFEHRGVGPIWLSPTGGGALIVRRNRSDRASPRQYTFLIEPDGTTSRVRASGKVEAYFHGVKAPA